MIKARVFHMCQVAAGDFQDVYIDVELPVLPPVGSLLKLAIRQIRLKLQCGCARAPRPSSL